MEAIKAVVAVVNHAKHSCPFHRNLKKYCHRTNHKYSKLVTPKVLYLTLITSPGLPTTCTVTSLLLTSRDSADEGVDENHNVPSEGPG